MAVAPAVQGHVVISSLVTGTESLSARTWLTSAALYTEPRWSAPVAAVESWQV